MNPLLLEIIKPLENDLEYEIVIDEGSIDFIKKGHLLSMPSMKKIPIVIRYYKTRL